LVATSASRRLETERDTATASVHTTIGADQLTLELASLCLGKACVDIDLGKGGNIMALDDVVVVNESSRFEIPGDVFAFADGDSAGRYLEAIDVANNEYFALSGDGRLLSLWTDGKRVYVEQTEATTNHAPRVHAWLRHAASAIAVQRKKKKRPNLEPPADEATIEQLIEYVGFTV
jgi:hypothetical protein